MKKWRQDRFFFAEPKIIDQFKNDDQKPCQKPQKTIEPMVSSMEIEQDNTVEKQKEPQEEEIFEDEDFTGFQEKEVNSSTSQQNLAKIIEVMRIESIDQSIEDVHWTMNDQWIELNEGGLLPAQNPQTSNSCTAFAVTAV
jgi:hypothetical protein